ncbi:MAG TPA: cation acetate symporter [Pirellulaceae bacterium]|nr:cation acetate symporter [Pirellulaceae bacterium]HMP70224.1 cation acetate symporter [Pirellulaceae bacterium]
MEHLPPNSLSWASSCWNWPVINSEWLLADIDGGHTDPARPWTWAFIGISFIVYLYIGWRSRVRDTEGFYVAGKGVPAMANGAATAADWMSAASFLGMAGLIAATGSDGAVYLLGWTGGYVLLALLLAPYLRKFGHYTVPEFIGSRYYSETGRVVAAICAIFISVTYVAGQMKGVGVIFSRFLEVPLEFGVVIGMAIVACFAVLGGMKGITWTQVAQYFVLIIAFLIPSVAISSMLTGHAIPQLGFVASDLSDKLNAALVELGEQEYTQPFRNFSRLNLLCITVALMFGTAGLPHVIVRFYTVKNVRAARYSAAWAILFIAVLYTTAPALAMFARYNLIQSLNGAKIERQIDTVEIVEKGSKKSVAIYQLISAAGVPLDWATNWQRTQMLRIEDKNNDGFVSLHSANGSSELVKLDNDIIVLSTPEIAGLPPWVIALVAAGGLAAALSTAAGLLLVISSSLAHDLFVRYFAPHATEFQRVTIGRITIFLSILLAGYVGINPPGFVAEVVAFAFGLAAASFFPAIFLGIFSKRVNQVGAISGMIVGMTLTLAYIVLCTAHNVLPMFFDKPLLPPEHYLLGISPQGFGTIGMLANFAVALIVSKMTSPPPEEVVELIENVRMPG